MATNLKREQSDVLQGPSKRAAATRKLEGSPELVTQLLFNSDVRDVVRTLLAHPATGEVTRKQLLAHKNRSFRIRESYG
ncbi:hypothetical protein AYL99_01567 [Fonsecaea erecta]|uniref:Uncharacterized protein n=1 Tax=Fonsecaea erecta TaxID=1367422 RepID=A0A179A374_9EURO|nr:hypothetical protein AYL99_01567 [Fonsecaea erecta]OAP65595.1 hypothetical protein AYL99_01567 [Fonsecaea erecta]